MKIALLSINPDNYSSKRIVEAGKERGHEVEVVNYLRCTMTITSHNPTVSYQGRKLNDFDAVIPRIGSSNTFYGCAVVRQFEMMGAYAVNPSLAISRSRDKLRCLQILAQKGIGLPVTSYAHDIEDVQEVIDAVGGAPLVVKLLEGTQGIGVVLCETKPAATSVIEAFRGLDANILAQEFISEAEGSDIRAFVVGDKVVAAMKRMSAKGEFRSNLHRGGTSEKVKLTPEERSTAVRAAKAMNLKVAGVDLLRSKHGPLVIEINSSPGLEGIEKTSEKPVGSMIIEYIEGAVETHKKDRVQA